MRTSFINTLHALAEADSRIELIVGDLGYGVVEPFAERFPTRFHNAGVAEQNMTGVAVGLALSGSVVFTYSLANFPTLRCLEQIRNDACYHMANLKVVTVGGGFAYGVLGVSHHATEDLAVLRAIPNLMVAAPGDAFEAGAITRQMVATPGPAYMRLSKAGEPVVHDREPELAPGTSITVQEGTDVTLISTGGLLPVARNAAVALDAEGVSVRCVSMPWLWPFDVDTVMQAGLETGLVVTLEEHSVIGGLGGAVSEVLAELPSHAPVLRFGVPRTFAPVVGTQDYLRALYGLDQPSVVKRVLDACRSGKVRNASAGSGRAVSQLRH